MKFQFRPIEFIALVLLVLLIIYVVISIFTHPFVNIGDGILCIGIFIGCVILVLGLAKV